MIIVDKINMLTKLGQNAFLCKTMHMQTANEFLRLTHKTSSNTCKCGAHKCQVKIKAYCTHVCMTQISHNLNGT